MRIHITGGAGSGKTTLAAQIAALIGCAAYDLDMFEYEGGGGGLRPPEARDADLQAVLREASWVTEGVYLDWTEPLFREADLVIWLDVPVLVALWRIGLRHVRADLSGSNRHPGYRKLLRFLGIVWRQYSERAPAVLPERLPVKSWAVPVAVRRYGAQMRRCRASAEARAVVAEIEQMQRLRG